MFPDNTVCNLASPPTWMKFYDAEKTISMLKATNTTACGLVVLEVSVLMAQFPPTCGPA